MKGNLFFRGESVWELGICFAFRNACGRKMTPRRMAKKEIRVTNIIGEKR